MNIHNVYNEMLVNFVFSLMFFHTIRQIRQQRKRGNTNITKIGVVISAEQYITGKAFWLLSLLFNM